MRTLDRERLVVLLNRDGLATSEAEELLILAMGLANSDIREIRSLTGYGHCGRSAANRLIDFGWRRLGVWLLGRFEE
jgi:hypothetical protein